MRLQQLQELYDAYVRESSDVITKAAPTDGLFGMGNDPRKDPCHMRFYEGVGQWVQDFLKEDSDGEETWQAVCRILTAPADHTGESVFWFMFAAQGHCLELIPRLTREQCAQLRQFYDDHYPKQDRMPVQKEVYRMLRKGSGKGILDLL